MIICGDCLEIMRGMESNSVDAIVTDPPYGLSFMGKSWDHGLPGEPFWAEALRVAKPGCHLLAFGGTRTFHRLACAIEDAGWELRDNVGLPHKSGEWGDCPWLMAWVYGSGFPKSESVSLAIDKKACRLELEARLGCKPTKEEMKAAWGGYREVLGPMSNPATPKAGTFNCLFDDSKAVITAPATPAARQWEGWGTALKPAWEPIILARKPLCGTVAENVLKWGTGAINVDGCRIPVNDTRSGGFGKGHRPWIKGSIGNNTTYEDKVGRWPANLIHDGSEEVLELFPQTAPTRPHGGDGLPLDTRKQGWGFKRLPCSLHDSGGSAARFFYCAKASRKEREMGCEGMPLVPSGSLEGGNDKRNGKDKPQLSPARNHHPTVKPLALMRYLCRLVTPPNGLVLDPFCGSGSTGIAALREGFRFIGIDNNAEYCAIARKRIFGTLMEPT